MFDHPLLGGFLIRSIQSFNSTLVQFNSTFPRLAANEKDGTTACFHAIRSKVIELSGTSKIVDGQLATPLCIRYLRVRDCQFEL